MTTLSVQRTGKASQGRSQPQSRVGKSSTFLIFPQISIIFFFFIFPQILLIFDLILPTREGPGYATEASSLFSK